MIIFLFGIKVILSFKRAIQLYLSLYFIASTSLAPLLKIKSIIPRYFSLDVNTSKPSRSLQQYYPSIRSGISDLSINMSLPKILSDKSILSQPSIFIMTFFGIILTSVILIFLSQSLNTIEVSQFVRFWGGWAKHKIDNQP